MIKSSKDEEGDRDMEEIHTKRSLQNLPPTYSPSLVFIHGKEYCDQTFATLSDGHYHIRSIPEMRQMRCIASCYGWLILQNRTDSSQCYLFNPISLTKIYLPPLRHSNFVVGVLTSSPIDRNCVVLLASTKRNSFVRCQIGDEKWIEKDLGPKAKRKSYKRYLFTRILSCGEKIYLFCEDGLFIIDVHNFTTKFHGKEWSDDVSLPGQGRAKLLSLKHFFVESCGDIFYLRIIYTYWKHIDLIIDDLKVFKLEVSTMAWVQVKSLDDRIFLLGATSSVSLSSTEFGMKGNCIYFSITNKYTTLCIFDMDGRTRSTTLPCPKHLTCWDGPFWVVPNRKLQMKKEAANKLEEVKYVEDVGKNLPIELLEIILSEPFLGDCIRFRLIFKSRIPVTPPFRPYTSLIQTKSGFNQLPWLLSMPKNKKGICNLYHPVYSDAYTMNIPRELAGADVWCAKYGWLLMSQRENSIFFFNPSSKETIQLPDIDHYKFVNITFSSKPTSPDCVVFCHDNSIILYVYRKCEEEDLWRSYRLHTGLDFSPAPCSAVLCDGDFYCLGQKGNLGILDPNDKDVKTMFNIIPNALAREVGSSSKSMLFRSFLMEYDGEILSVIVGHSSAKPVWIYKFDLSKMEWIKIESLGDKVIFVSRTRSIVVPAGFKGLENRIYFPRFQGRDIVYYSLSTRKYHCFGREVSAEDWIYTCEDFNCTWIQIQNREDLTKRDAAE